MRKVVVIINQLNEAFKATLLMHLQRLETRYPSDQTPSFTVEILDSRYHPNYAELKRQYETFKQDFTYPVSIKSVYLDQYFVSDKVGNVNGFTNNFLGTNSKSVRQNKAGNKTLMEIDGSIRVAINYAKNGQTIQSVDYANPGQNHPIMRALVNHDGNIQVLRHFNITTHKPGYDEYLDSELDTFMIVKYDQKGLRESYQFTHWGEEAVNSEIDLYMQWIRPEIDEDTIIVNYNRDLDILFETVSSQANIYMGFKISDNLEGRSAMGLTPTRVWEYPSGRQLLKKLKNDERMLVFGDSIVAGQELVRGETPYRDLVYARQAAYKLGVYAYKNLAETGVGQFKGRHDLDKELGWVYTFSNVIDHHEKDVAKASLILIAYGNNDWKQYNTDNSTHTLDEVKQELSGNIKKIRQINNKSEIIGVLETKAFRKGKDAWDMLGPNGFSYGDMVNAYIEVYEQEGVHIFDMRKYGIGETIEEYVDDRDHFTKAVHGQLGDALVSFIRDEKLK